MEQTDEIRKYYDELATTYDSNRFGNTYGSFIHRQEYPLLKHELKERNTILDLACGTGRFLDLAQDGLDVSSAMLKESAKKYPNKTLHCSTAWDIPVPDHKYDAVFSMHLLMHLPKAQFTSVLNEVDRVLQPNGLFIFDVPSAWRRTKIGYQKSGWHGNSAYSLEEIQQLTSEKWVFKHYHGIMFLPIHHIPKAIRSTTVVFDTLLNKYFFKRFSSYYLIILQKNP